jgi:KUP system potassium uptake protein
VSSDKQPASLARMAIGAIGVVYGDIATSPLYSMKAIFGRAGEVPLTPDNVVGVVSVILWALTIIVSVKYVALILRADNHGEGGIMALLALATGGSRRHLRWRSFLLVAGVFGAALFYGDGVITPAISVLSAVEGLELAAPATQHYVVPIAIVVLAGLFWVQHRGTSTIGKAFGPVMLLWLLALAVVGVLGILRAPRILHAIDPRYAYAFLSERGWVAFTSLGAIVLTLTGAEALYADMGHFGRRPIRVAWFGFVFPALALNYLGQGALLLAQPSAVADPFYLLFPQPVLLPAILLATAATVIAAQAVISGTFSMTRQAMQLGFLPPMRIVYTSIREIGQIYIPLVNTALLVAVVGVVLGFRSSDALASAYGIAVTGTMLITTVLTYFVVRDRWRLPMLAAFAATLVFFLIDLAFFASNTLKFAEGGWFPLVVGAAIFTVMTTWRRGREILVAHLKKKDVPLETFIDSLASGTVPRVPGTAVFLANNPDGTPPALIGSLAHFRIIHERIVFLNVIFEEIPWVPFARRVALEAEGENCFRVTVRYGFKNEPDVPKALELCGAGVYSEPDSTTYFVGRAAILPVGGHGMVLWRTRLFGLLMRNAGSSIDFLKLPASRVIELGMRVEL